MTQALSSIFAQLRGYDGFEEIYSGRSVAYPIPLSTKSNGLDPDAAEEYQKLLSGYRSNGGSFPIGGVNGNGYSPFLLAGLPVPLYSTVTAWLPPLNITANNPKYQYQFVWRMRNAQTALGKGIPFHGQNNGFGFRDSGENNFLVGGPAGPAWLGTAQDRFQLIASEDSLLYAQTEPTGGAIADKNLYWVQTVPASATQYLPPLLPGFAAGQVAYGQISQGLVPDGTYGAPSHIPVTLRAMGDELIVMVNRTAGAAANWNFATVDLAVSQVLGRGILIGSTYEKVNAGVLITTGVAP